MVTERWVWQDGTTEYDVFSAVAVGPDGSCVLAGKSSGNWSETNAGNSDQVIVKLDKEGGELWRYQNGTEGSDGFQAVAMNQQDGSVVLGGSTYSTGGDFSVVKLDADGLVLWEFQAGTLQADECHGIAIAEDGSVVAVGFANGTSGTLYTNYADFAAFGLDASGEELWRYQDGTANVDWFYAAAMVDGDMSVVMVGGTKGNFSGTPSGRYDMVAVKLDAASGAEIWRNQEGTARDQFFRDIAATVDGGVVLVGYSDGDWSGPSAGGEDVIAVKLSSEGEELWRWQNGTAADDWGYAITVQADGSILLAGYTEGDWDGTSAGERDVIMVALSPDGEELWRWQDGTDLYDYGASTAAGSDGRVIVAGSTLGSWGAINRGSGDFLAVMLEMPTVATSAPSAVPSPAPTTTFSPARTPAPFAIVGATSAPVAAPAGSTPAPVVDAVSSAPTTAPATSATPAPAELGTIDRAAPVGTSDGAAPVAVILGGAVGGAVLLSGLILLALFKTGRITIQKRDRSSAARGSASHPTLPQYPTIPKNPATSAAQYPTRP